MKRSIRPTGDDLAYDDDVIGGFGSVTTWGERDPDDAPLPREFAPGFHCAAPGPSRDETPKRRRK